MGPATEHEELFYCKIADRDAVVLLCDGMDAFLHFGGVPTELEFGQIIQANIPGMVNLYEAVQKRRIQRVAFAGSTHASGMYPNTEVIDAPRSGRA